MNKRKMRRAIKKAVEIMEGKDNSLNIGIREDMTLTHIRQGWWNNCQNVSGWLVDSEETVKEEIEEETERIMDNINLDGKFVNV